VRDADEFGASCAQEASPLTVASDAEDCLFLNVYAPRGRAHGRPVMVWFHGGGLVGGSGDFYDPAGLVRDGVVVVTINYRLGALGFLAHPALAAAPGGPSGDYGLMDQQAALRWVSRNAARFGGDPGNVTVFGESAGGLSVLSQLVSPGARGLLDRAIVQSGAYALTLPSLADAETAGQAFAAAAGCADQSSACLRALPVRTLLANQGNTVPNVDGRVLPQSLDTALATGQFTRVPVINGSTRDEWRLFVAIGELSGSPVTEQNYLAMIAGTLGVSPEVAAVVAARYPLSAYPSPSVALGAVGTDAIFACPALTVSKAVSRFVPTYGYEFADRDAPPLLPPVSFPQGAAHASELPYLFRLPIGGTLTPEQQQLAAGMRRLWTGFAASGTPPGWPRFTQARQPLLSLVPPRPVVATDFAATHQCAFWSAVNS
jgi:para-nitrobenzyl esterase